MTVYSSVSQLDNIPRLPNKLISGFNFLITRVCMVYVYANKCVMFLTCKTKSKLWLMLGCMLAYFDHQANHNHNNFNI